jgi:hypothetical protein
MSNKYQKVNPDGVDAQIQRLQSWLYTKLANEGWTLHESYERCYKTKRDDKIIPEIFIDNEYRELLLDDKVNVTSFFLVDDNENISDRLCTINIQWIIQANIKNLYPSITHRADEELRSDLKRLLKLNPYQFRLTGCIQGIESVYDSLKINIKFTDDMNQFHVCRFNLELNYNINNC